MPTESPLVPAAADDRSHACRFTTTTPDLSSTENTFGRCFGTSPSGGTQASTSENTGHRTVTRLVASSSRPAPGRESTAGKVHARDASESVVDDDVSTKRQRTLGAGERAQSVEAPQSSSPSVEALPQRCQDATGGKGCRTWSVTPLITVPRSAGLRRKKKLGELVTFLSKVSTSRSSDVNERGFRGLRAPPASINQR